MASCWMEEKGASLSATDCSPAEIPWRLLFIVGVVVTPKNEKGIRAIILRGDRRLSLNT